jgi:hypothetical protein
VTTSRKYSDRLETLANVRDAGISVCAGGIIGLGEGEGDRVGLIHQLATLPEHPESVPINRLVAVKGTPFQVPERRRMRPTSTAADLSFRPEATDVLVSYIPPLSSEMRTILFSSSYTHPVHHLSMILPV